jgi:antitoxin ParD1/3/4
MRMTSLNISLPEPLKAYVESKVEAGDYGTPSEYVRELIRRDKQTQLRWLESELVDALRSGNIELSEAELQDQSIVNILRKKLGSKSGKKV